MTGAPQREDLRGSEQPRAPIRSRVVGPRQSSGGGTAELARAALRRALLGVLPRDRARLVGATGRTAHFEDNLVPTLTVEQVIELREQLSGGDGQELTSAADGTRPDAHAAHSSSALAFNAFGAWLGREAALLLDGVGGFDQRLRVEALNESSAAGEHRISIAFLSAQRSPSEWSRS